jgi:HEAT repeat protein
MMKRKRLLLIGALAVVVAGVALGLPGGPKEPVYEGRGINYWINEIPATGMMVATEKARLAVRASGAKSLEYLMSEFTRRETILQRVANQLKRVDPLTDLSVAERQAEVELAGIGLALLGPDVASALPELAGLLGDEQRGYTAARILGNAGEAAVPHLMTAIESPNALVAANAGRGIEELAGNTGSILPTLFAWLQHPNPARREIAVSGLGMAPTDPERIVPALVAALADTEPDVQSRAAYALIRKGQFAIPAVPVLRRLMTNGPPKVAAAASNAVVGIDPTALPRPTN